MTNGLYEIVFHNFVLRLIDLLLIYVQRQIFHAQSEQEQVLTIAYRNKTNLIIII